MTKAEIVETLLNDTTDFLSDRYAEYITTDDLDKQWTPIVLEVLTSLLKEYQEATD